MLWVLPHRSISSPKLLYCDRNGKSKSKFRQITSAKRSNTGEESSSFAVRISKPLVAKSAIAVFALGFIDAGYSGDWSRIGAVSKETEEILKVAAYLVVPLCFLLASLITDEDKAQ